jgi:hypothetical protein
VIEEIEATEETAVIAATVVAEVSTKQRTLAS